MKYYCDSNPSINLDIIPLPFPLPNDTIVDRAEEAIGRWNVPAIPNYTGQAQPTGKDVDGRVRLVVVDSIASNPGYVRPLLDSVTPSNRFLSRPGALAFIT